VAAGWSLAVSTSLPVAALTVLGILVAMLGLFAAGDIGVVGVGLVAIFGAGLLEAAARRTT
jgi:hypothetical protein